MKHWSMPQALWIGVLGLCIFGSNLAVNVLEAFLRQCGYLVDAKTNGNAPK